MSLLVGQSWTNSRLTKGEQTISTLWYIVKYVWVLLPPLNYSIKPVINLFYEYGSGDLETAGEIKCGGIVSGYDNGIICYVFSCYLASFTSKTSKVCNEM